MRARAFLGHALGRGEGETGGAPLGQSLGRAWGVLANGPREEKEKGRMG